MNTQKIAITVPSDLLDIIDKKTEQRSMSRSKFISLLLREKLLEERDRQLKDQYDRVFSDSAICDEQLKTAMGFDGAGSREGQEW
jgi:metal-responsive CopG/Arc/MetJ family transcriptional regulator